VDVASLGGTVQRIGRFFSFEGRAKRGTYWFVTLAMTAAIVILACAAVALTVWQVPGAMDLPKEELRDLVRARVLNFAPLIVLCVVLGVSVTVRRLHDRGKSGAWAVLFYLPTLLQWFGWATGGSALPDMADWLALPIGIWALVELGFLEGTDGPNRFDAAAKPAHDAPLAELPTAYASADRALTAAIERRAARPEPPIAASAGDQHVKLRRAPQPSGFGRKLAH
jgi:uncharacterized membrane protein YhaH (DUF805 family)